MGSVSGAGKLIDEAAVKKAGGSVLADGSGICIQGWTIQTRKAGISGEQGVEQLKRDVGNVVALPEQLFGDNVLRLYHAASGTELSFTARDAVKQWKQEGRPAVRVRAAPSWLASRQHELTASGTPILDYDWTFSTSYTGTLSREGRPLDEGAWQESPAPLNRALLLARDPILFFDDLPLYASELDDNGISELSVKVRVMPACWFVLLRFWLRVDGVLLRLAEARWLAAFPPAPQDAALVREIRVSEGTYQELRGRGAPSSDAAYGSGEDAAAALMAIAPTGVKRFVTQQLPLAPAPAS